MPYEIKNGKIVAKDTKGQNRSFPKDAIDAIIGECKRRGVTNKYIIAGILATISKESAFVPKNEDLSYSLANINKNFGIYFGGIAKKKERREEIEKQKAFLNISNPKPSDYAHKAEKLANYVYGPPRGGHKNPGDGWKFRGRGFNQITFKSSYEKYGKNIPGLRTGRQEEDGDNQYIFS